MNITPVNVPVVLYVWSRPDKLKQVFNVVKKAQPNHLFLISDGAIDNRPDLWELIYESRTIVEDVDWDCEVHKIYLSENIGLYNMFKRMSDYVFSKVDRYIFLEDDVVPSLSFFKYCEVLLEKYKDDLRINMICGMNHLGTYKTPNSDYFFTRGAASIWGFAIWKRTYEEFYNFDFTKDSYVFNLLVQNSKEFKSFNRSLYCYHQNEKYYGHIAGPEFFLGLSSFAHNQLSIIPTMNMVCNIGHSGGGVNFNNKKLMLKKIAKLFDMRTYEYEFPLKHPKYVIEDNLYKSLVLDALARSNKIIDKIEGVFRNIYYDRIPRFFGQKVL